MVKNEELMSPVGDIGSWRCQEESFCLFVLTVPITMYLFTSARDLPTFANVKVQCQADSKHFLKGFREFQTSPREHESTAQDIKPGTSIQYLYFVEKSVLQGHEQASLSGRLSRYTISMKSIISCLSSLAASSGCCQYPGQS